MLHPPYTLWHLSYVVWGAALVPQPDYALLAWTVLAFFLAMGIGAHTLDELQGRPLGTHIPARVLWALGVGSAGAAAAIGLTVGVAATPLVLPCIAMGVFLVFAYNLEWGPFHRDLTFALAWGAFLVEVEGGQVPITREWLMQDGEQALALLSAIMPLLALGLLLK